MSDERSASPRSPRHPLERPLTLLDRASAFLERFVLTTCILLMAVLSITNVIGRTWFDRSLVFVTEANQALIILITFIGLSYGVRQGRHIRMSALYDQLGGRLRKGLMVFTALGTAVLLFALAWYAGRYAAQIHDLGTVTPALRIPLYLIYLAAPLGFAMGGFQYLLAAFRNLTTPGVHLSYTQPEAYEDPQIHL